LKAPAGEAASLARAVAEMKEKVRLCIRCFNLADQELCEFCRDERRDATTICVVQEPPDIVAIERTREFRGLYHVLHGAISPMDGVYPDDLRIAELLERVRGSNGQPPAQEVIVATNPNTEGTATAMYLARVLGPLEVQTTRLASGLPVGGDLEYADEVTLGRALEGRRQITG
jgi:recombination protein RecR